eukprot:scaffold160768_cov36-Tisochrysis_lutea.AAC.3
MCGVGCAHVCMQVLPEMLHGTAERLLRILSYEEARQQAQRAAQPQGTDGWGWARINWSC